MGSATCFHLNRRQSDTLSSSDTDMPSVVPALMTVDSAICPDGLDGVSVITAVLGTFSMMGVGVMMSSVFDFVALGFDVELWTAVDFPLVET